MRREPAGWTVLLSVTGAPFAPVSWTRLKGLRLGEQVVVSVLATVVLVGPYLVVYLNVEERQVDHHVFWFFGGLAVAEAVVVPLLWRATDALERRVAEWLARRDAP